MGKNSSMAMYTQLMEWLPTLKSKRSKPTKSSIHAASKSNDRQQPNEAGYDSIRIKNGPKGRR